MSAHFQHDVFLSRNRADMPRVRQLAERLRAANLRVWKAVSAAPLPASNLRSTPTWEQEEQWRRADEEVWKNLPPGVNLAWAQRTRASIIRLITWSRDGPEIADVSSGEHI